MTLTLHEPVVVVHNSMTSRYSNDLMKQWDQILSELKQVYPRLRTHIVTTKYCWDKFDPNIVPADLSRYQQWTPMLILIPGIIWDNAMANLAPNNPVSISDGVQIWNGVWVKDQLRFESRYDYRSSKDYTKWLKLALDQEDFRRVQNSWRQELTLIQWCYITCKINGVNIPEYLYQEGEAWFRYASRT